MSEKKKQRCISRTGSKSNVTGAIFSFSLQQGRMPNGLKTTYWDPFLKGSTITQATDQTSNTRVVERLWVQIIAVMLWKKAKSFSWKSPLGKQIMVQPD